MAKPPAYSTCPCGSGKPYVQCCGSLPACQVVHFPRGKRSNYRTLIETALGDLLNYARKFYANWEEPARARFLSSSQIGEISDRFMPLFWEWYVLNYRYHKDISPLIDFFLADSEIQPSASHMAIYQALKVSYLSIHQIRWIHNHTVATRDIFTGQENIIERDFGSVTQFIEEGMLLLTRIISIDNVSIITGRPIIVFAEQKTYIYEEVNSVMSSKGMSDRSAFLRENAEILCGLAIDLSKGIKKMRVKIKSLELTSLDHKAFIQQFMGSRYFYLLDRKEYGLVFTWRGGKGVFKRIYFRDKLLVVAGEEKEDVNLVVQLINTLAEKCLNSKHRQPDWMEGIYLDEDGGEDIQMEILHDRHLEEWLKLPHPELEGMNPVDALHDIRGRVLLENLLSALEMQEIRAKSRGEYFYPTSVIRKKLGLNRERISKELLFPQAVSIQVEKHRLRQQLGAYITAYNWLNDAYSRVATTLFDMYDSKDGDQSRLAWLLYMWNEFTLVYRPRISRDIGWIAGLEYTLSVCQGKSTSYDKVARYFGLSPKLVSKHSYLLARHFKQFPLDFNHEMSVYPVWEDLDDYEMIQSYEEVWQHLNLFTYSIDSAWHNSIAENYRPFADEGDISGFFWNESSVKTYQRFVRGHYLLDREDDGHSIMRLFWDKQASRFPPYLRTAAYNLLTSYIGVYEIKPGEAGGLVFKNRFTGQQSEVYGRVVDEISQHTAPGMLGIGRLLPLGERLWVNDSVFMVMKELIPLFEKNLLALSANNNDDAKGDVSPQKKGALLVRAYVKAVKELERSTLLSIQEPLNLTWEYANVDGQGGIKNLLKQGKYFRLLREDAAQASYLWLRSCYSNKQWSYILLADDKMYLFVPPGKDRDKLWQDIGKSIECSDIAAAGTCTWPASALDVMEKQMIADLSQYFKENLELSWQLMSQDNLNDEEMEVEQGIFLLKLASAIKQYLQENCHFND